MRCVVGLGNPGEKYQNNRHNAGYMFIDYLLKQYQNAKMNQWSKSEIAELIINKEKVLLVKPQTFMNQSGQTVKSCVTRYTLHVTRDLYLVHDDLDIKLGEVKLQKGVGPKLHNGILSVEQALGTADFWRVRIGVDNRDPERRVAGETYVLQNFKEEEKNRLTEVFSAVMKTVYGI